MLEYDIIKHTPQASSQDAEQTTTAILYDDTHIINIEAIRAALGRVSRLSYFLSGLWLGGCSAAYAWGVLLLWMVGSIVVGAAVIYVTRQEV